jgi:sigma-B regulation protein RsbU (phosphoserine phosphatase)
MLESAREVGGDLYEVLNLGDGRIFVAVGDVSGKGIPAALFMAVTTTLLRTLARHHAEPADILQQVNNSLSVQNPRGMFVTMLCMIIDLKTNTITCANAGHPSPVLLRSGSEPRMVLNSTAMVAGIMADIEIGSESLRLEPGDSLLTYTDGVTEAFSPSGELFGDERLLEAVRGKVCMNAKDSASITLNAVRAHANGCPQSDDITVLTLRRS